MPESPEVPGGSPEYVKWAVDGSLERLRTDCIDVYMYHRPDSVTPLTETLGALGELAREGKIRFAGLSNVDAGQVEEAAAFAAREGVPLVAIENRYSLVRREAEADLMPLCERLGLGFLPYYPLESGLLTGKYRRGQPPPPDSRFETRPGIWKPERWLNDDMFERTEALERFGAERGLPLLAVALGGTAAMPAVASVIAGATRPGSGQGQPGRRRMDAVGRRPRRPARASVAGRREMPVETFEVAVPQATLDDLRDRLARVRWPIDPANPEWVYGVERGYLEELVDYWRTQTSGAARPTCG